MGNGQPLKLSATGSTPVGTAKIGTMKLRVKIFILLAFFIGMVQIAILNFVPIKWVPPYFSGILLVDVVLVFLAFHKIDKA